MAGNNDIPQPFRGIETRDQARTAVNEMRTLVDTITSYPTFLERIPNEFASYVRDAFAAGNDQAKRSAVSAKLLSDNLRDAVPAVAQFYILSGKFVTAAKATIEELSAQLDNLRYDDFLAPGTECTDPDLINLYNTLIDKFRAGLTGRGIVLDRELISQEGEVRNVLNVFDQAPGIGRMLETMNRKRAATNDRENIGAEHLQEVRQVLAGDWNMGFMFSFVRQTRAATGFGAMLVGNEWVERPAGMADRGNALLLSSALARDSQLLGDLLTRAEAFVADERNAENVNLDLLKRAVVEARSMLKPDHPDAGAGAGFQSQRSNIDPLFLTFYIAFKQLALTVKDFYLWQGAIYTAGRMIRGKGKMTILLRSLVGRPGIADMINKLSQSTAIHSPPWVLNSSRIYDMVAAIGICDTFNPNATITTPGISWRYFFNIRLNRPELIKLVVALNTVEGINEGAIDEIIQAERILYQLIVGRTSSVSSTNHIIGNALNVEIQGV
ncbi:nucleocapsid protein [red goblin roach virus 1]|uniref:Nucleocapsid protein n=1 Tax=red goblin roach virus 1 TaxID=3118717 RepID=A0A7D7F187_9VIRU|nr:nucleocapsid protein [red goblin roach virus 1]QMP82319.1 nucleocapsid protein [red goblin roach virus 1]